MTVYVDLNNNDTFDNDLDAELEAGEDPFAVTDANGAWTISGLGPTAGGKEVREVTPPGYTQTVGQDGTVVNTDYLVTATSGNNSQTAFNFANFLPFSISGKKVIDTNGDGSIAGDNTAHAGVTIYIDFDNDGVFDAGEKSAITDGSGNWSITGLDASFTGKLVRENATADYITTVGGNGIAITGTQPDRGRLRQLPEVLDFGDQIRRQRQQRHRCRRRPSGGRDGLCRSQQQRHLRQRSRRRAGSRRGSLRGHRRQRRLDDFRPRPDGGRQGSARSHAARLHPDGGSGRHRGQYRLSGHRHLGQQQPDRLQLRQLPAVRHFGQEGHRHQRRRQHCRR